jgi:hypothetical protein
MLPNQGIGLRKPKQTKSDFCQKYLHMNVSSIFSKEAIKLQEDGINPQ